MCALNGLYTEGELKVWLVDEMSGRSPKGGRAGEYILFGKEEKYDEG